MTKETTEEKKIRKARVEKERKERKEKNRATREKEMKRSDSKEDIKADSELPRAERRKKGKNFGVKILGALKPIVGSQKVETISKPVTQESKVRVVPIHYDVSLPVSNWQAIIEEATEMARIMDKREIQYENGRFHTGFCWALHHMQVSNNPFNFFVLSSLVPDDVMKELGSRFIVNPKIDKTMVETVQKLREGCVSFPNKSETKVSRAWVIDVSFQIPDAKAKGGLKSVKKQVAGIVAQIFQHECDHAEGKNIYYKEPKK